MLGRLEQRGDDTEEKVNVRPWQFHANAVEVDGTQRLEEVPAMIMKTIDAVLA